jgi:predicted DNA-binding helix-hairpin-helix protein
LLQDKTAQRENPISVSSPVLGLVKRPTVNRGFVPAGQSTQMIIGATPENDYQIISVAEALYQKFDLKRVFYSAYVQVNEDSSLPSLPGGPPLLREHRLYQADFLLRFYGFQASELLSETRPNFNILIDPKCNWALGHLGEFPVEVNKADYYTLLRVPGIGVKSAERIVKARQSNNLRFEDLKKIGVVLKRALYFITCGGKMMYPVKIEENYITNQLISIKEKLPPGIGGSDLYRQLSLFDDVNFNAINSTGNRSIYL